jgi:hypothetical protein
LAVCGLTLEAGQTDEAFGAFLLFLTNVTAIIFTATIVLMLYCVRDVAKEAGFAVGQLHGSTLAVVALLVVLVSIPLTYSTGLVILDTRIHYSAAPVVDEWAESEQWSIQDYSVTSGVMTVVAIGPPPSLDPQTLRTSLDEAGFSDVDVDLDLVVGGSTTLPGSDQSS